MSAVQSEVRRFHLPGTGVPARKPVPQIITPKPSSPPGPKLYPAELQRNQDPGHSRSRTASSGVFPPASEMQVQTQQQYVAPRQPSPRAIPQNYMAPVQPLSKRTPSTATTASTVSTNPNVPMRQNSGSSLQRSTSSRSGSSPTSYVALMRKQKATVWSDRAQHEDPRLVQAQRLAKARATAEVSSASLASARTSTANSSSSITGGVRSKIRHHGAPKAREFQSGLPTSGVPMRLSQNEIDEGDDDDDQAHLGQYGMHKRTGSGRSSVNSGGRLHSMYGMPQQGHPQPGAQMMRSNGSTPPGTQSRGSPSENRLQEQSPDETPVPDHRRQDYFAPPSAIAPAVQPSPQARPEAGRGDSGSSEREDSFGQAGKLPLRVRNVEEEEEQRKMEAELRRRGSVDERTMTMSGYGKLFIANPDA